MACSYLHIVFIVDNLFILEKNLNFKLLFIISAAGAGAYALYYSIIETSKSNKLNTYDYLFLQKLKPAVLKKI